MSFLDGGAFVWRGFCPTLITKRLYGFMVKENGYLILALKHNQN